MFFKKKRSKKQKDKEKNKEMKIITVSVDEVRKAINNYTSTLQEGISLRCIIKENNEIDFELLYAHLGGMPDKSFYMSKETFEVFEDQSYAKYIDLCQIACDQYLLETGMEPITPGDPYRKINYLKLQNYLTEKPPFDLYLHPEDQMVTPRALKDS
ncbi:hypothetical protein J2S74_004321 [Evansella vedderi]|uniref:Uncharacterized protein n=1 Tax=Evansella vedderi TaxID=38282 RepID=A0ABU0A1A0_9BACI|nr:DUF3939 domain-containing protein [Evansella vedderi]MDQ0256899.1 hypothetical protein [Evansella vedderi]